MAHDENQSSNLVMVTTVGLSALVAATVFAFALSGAVQAVALSVCFAVMGVSVLINLTEQRKLERLIMAPYGEATENATAVASAFAVSATGEMHAINETL